jgi:hypothetical protein
MTDPSLTLALIVVIAPLAGAQATLGTLAGNASLDVHTYAVGGFDLNADGVPDLIVGAPFVDTGAPDGGRVYAYSGKDQSVLWEIHGTSPSGNFGSSLAWTDDYDADGVPDVVIGAPYTVVLGANRGLVSVRSGSTGAAIYSKLGDDPFEGFGLAVAGGFDWNEDGVTDFAVGTPLDDDAGLDAGSFTVYDGSDGSKLVTIHGDNPGELLGWSLIGAGQVDGDVYGDLAVGAPNADSFVGADVGLVRAYGGSGAVIWSRWGTIVGDNLGYSVAAAGDVDGDGFAEILGGEPNNDDFGTSAGRVVRFDGETGAPSGVWHGAASNDWFGYSIAGVGDLNGDSIGEWVAGGPQVGGVAPGYARVIDGAAGSTLFSVSGDLPGEHAGWTVGRAGDLNQDGIDDVFFGARDGAGPNGNVGWVRVFSGGCGSVVNYCTAGSSASGCQPTLVTSGVPLASAPSGFTVLAFPLEGDKDGLFFFGWNGRQANAWGNGSSYQCVVPPVNRGGIVTGSGTPGTCTGTLLQDMNARWFNKPTQNPGSGSVVQLQCWYRDPLNTSNQTTSLSDAIEFIVCP